MNLHLAVLSRSFANWLETKYFVHIKHEGECRIWTGNIDKGFGRVYYRGRRSGAHRVAWLLRHNPTKAHTLKLPRGAVLMQTCGNRLCCNPSHLKLTVEIQQHLSECS